MKDVMLYELALRIRAEHRSLQTYLDEDRLDGAFLRARSLQKTLDGMMERLNDLKYRPDEVKRQHG